MTERKVELSECEKILLNQKLTLIDDAIHDGHHPEVTLVYFVSDALKEGGEYQEFTDQVRLTDTVERKVVFLAENGWSAGKAIYVDDILEIHGELVDYIEDM